MNTEISRETIDKIRALAADAFEPAFINQLRIERRISMVIVYFMKEAFRRKVWAQSYPTFSGYCIDRLKMSDSDFYRKFSLMKTIEELPDIEEKILDGSLHASTVAKMSHFFHRESKVLGIPISVEQKRDMFQKVEGLSHRAVERELVSISPLSALPDRTKQITETAFVRQFTSTQELELKLTRAKELLAHSLPSPPSDCQLFTKITDIALEKIDPELKQRRLEERERKTKHKTSPDEMESSQRPEAPVIKAGNRVHIPEAVRREVLKRDEYACVHVNHDTGKICGSKYAIELDHIIPIGHGGDDSIENLRVLCRTHNQLRALETYGRRKMAEHVKSMN